MTGLNLETFLRLLRVDTGIWASLGVIALILALMTWTSWGSRRALRKCLFLSIAVHVGLIVYGSNSPLFQKVFQLGAKPPRAEEADRKIRVTPWSEADRSPSGQPSVDGQVSRKVATWDQDRTPLAMAGPDRASARPEPVLRSDAKPEPPAPLPPLTPDSVAPELSAPAPPPAELSVPVASKGLEPPMPVASADPEAVAPAPSPMVSAASDLGFPGEVDLRSRSRGPRPPATRAVAASPPAREPVAMPTPSPGPTLPESTRDVIPPPRQALAATGPATPAMAEAVPDPLPPAVALGSMTASAAASETGMDLPEADIRRRTRSTRAATESAPVAPPRRLADASIPLELARATPAGPSSFPAASGPVGRRPLAEVPPVYRSRLDPNRTALAQRAGASLASEQAVERALAWLARHQDADGRWDGATARGRDGNTLPNDDCFTIHCPPGDTCYGECFYPEADTALTGLSLLAYLGAGYTHVDGKKYAPVVAQGLEFLRRSQKPDGDLRGESTAVGMYCHSMATLALTEAYALTGDARLRLPVEKAVGFLVRARSSNAMAWRYAPGAADSDTSILGWAVMALKSAKVVGIPIPPSTQAGISTWLGKVAAGPAGGLARYQPGQPETPTMTAEAWACRQFLELGGPGRASDEAAAFLLMNESEGGDFNIYYLYYGTLAMYQHGGEPWAAWNARVRDRVVGRQQIQGHKAGSWDPDDSKYSRHGGRIYETALSTLTLEVYYRFLRLYEPAPPTLAPRPGDAGTRRAGFELKPGGQGARPKNGR